jgi:hypothetical protein
MSTKTATSSFKPCLEGLENRVTPSGLPQLGPVGDGTNSNLGVTTDQVGATGLDVILRKAGGINVSPWNLPPGDAGGALSQVGGHGHGDSLIASDGFIFAKGP